MSFRDLINGQLNEMVGPQETQDLIIEAFEITEEELNEASFSLSKLTKVSELYAKILGKRMGGVFHSLGMEDYTRKRGPGKGIRFINNKGVQLRFNYDLKIAKKGNYEMTSIDYYDSSNKSLTKPTRTVILPSDLNVVSILDKVETALLTGRVNESFDVNEARTGKEKQEWLQSKGLPKSLAGSMSKMKARAEQEGLGAELEVFLGEEETNSTENEVKEVQKKFSKEVYANPETVFEDIEDLLSVVASGKWRTLIVCGMGGIGKTYHITEGPRSLKALLGPAGDKWEYHSGTKAAPYAFYKTLFQERDKIIVFDEADSLLKNQDIVMMLKPILDTSGDNMASYMSNTENMVGKNEKEIRQYCAEIDDMIADGQQIGLGKDDVKLPSKFYFEGAMIFISNMRAKEIEGAIMSRSIFVDVYLAQQDVLKRIKSIATAMYGAEETEILMEGLGQSSSMPEEEVQYMTPEYARKMKPFTVRSMALAHILKSSGLSRWAELAQLYA